MTSAIPSAVFVARAEEMARLTDAYERARSDGPVTVLIGGEAGIGKTRLVNEFTASLTARVVTGGCLPLGADGLPYAPFVALMRGLVRGLGVSVAAQLLPGGGRRGLAHWLPELGEADGVPDPSYGRARLFGEVLTLVESAAGEGPLVLVVEDLHWADASSQELLLYLVRNLTHPGVLLLVTHRSTGLDATHPVRSLLGALGRLGPVRRVDPAPLGRADVEQLLTVRQKTSVDVELAERVYRRSEGNPLFVEALADTGAGEATPAPLRDLLLAGLHELSDAGRRCVRAASAVDDVVGQELLVAVTGLPDRELEDALRPAVERRLLVPADDGYTFRHALIRSAVYEDLLPGERIRLHTRYARTLEADPGLLPPGRAPAALAAHWYAAGDRVRAAEAAWYAAESARHRYAYAEALRLLERVLELGEFTPKLPELGDVLGAAAEAALCAGEAERGTALATAALDESGDPETSALLLETRSLLGHLRGRDGLDDLRAALALLPQHAETVRGRLHATLASRLAGLSRTDEAAEHATEALRLGRAVGDPGTQGLALVTLGAHAARNGDPAGAVDLCREGSRLALLAGRHETVVLAAVMESIAFKAAGAYADAAAVARSELGRARRTGIAGNRGAVLSAVYADALIALGDWTEARATVRDALAQDPPPLYRAVLLTNLGTVDVAQGETGAARTAATEAARLIGGEYSGREFLLPLHDLQCQVALADGLHEEANRVFGTVLADPELPAHAALAWPLLRTGRQICDLLGAHDRVRADALRAQLAVHAKAFPSDRPVEAAHRTTFEAWYGNEQAAWDSAAEAWRTLGHRGQLAFVLLGAAESALAAGDRATAADRLREAETLAAALGAAPLAREIGLLAARGRLALDVPAEGRPDGLGLTPRETEVLRLVAEGHSNRRIAQELFISAKTAGVHVSNILAKLDVTSRTEAAALAHRLRLFG
ncbi:AAA family ATPase [Streptomyces sp. NBC_01465]|uniref:AAA family ATPase n=1 Tax=Streptomyces sp. NBC_01465 TaxID=2903878 RepID=UPI002E36EC97|nr:AAA family ATPase [Streptomyces sp. NBC_01465]